MRRLIFCATLLVSALLLSGAGVSLYSQRTFPAPRPPIGRDDHGTPPSMPSPSRKMLKESFQQTQKDVAELSDLVADLKVETDKADADVLSLTVMKKAEAIEKLAEKIKNRMKNL